MCFLKKILPIVLIACLWGSIAHARQQGFYFGGGYQQPIMFTWEDRLAEPGKNVSLWPGFGAFLTIGNDFEKIDWLGIAFPINWNMLRLNSAEWVHLINVDGEVLFHILDPDEDFDFYFAVLAGFNFLTEGPIKDETQSIGPDFGCGVGLKYTLMEYVTADTENVTNLSLFFEVPFRVMLFLNDYDLSDSSTTAIISIPIRIGLTYSF